MEKTKNIRLIPKEEHYVNPEQRNEYQHEEKKRKGFRHLERLWMSISTKTINKCKNITYML